MGQQGFDGYRIDARLRRLLGPNGEPVALSGKAFDVLLHLMAHPGQVVTKDELLTAVWPGRVIEENTLTQAISLVRRALGSNASDHRHIVTLPGRGYRFVAEVEEFDESPEVPAPAVIPVAVFEAPLADATRLDATHALPDATTSTSQRRTWLLGGLLVATALLAFAGLRQQRTMSASPSPAEVQTRRAPVSLAVLPFRSLSGGTYDQGLELGLAETLITHLSRSPSLQVPALSSAQRLPGGVAAKDVGRQLGVAYVVDGTTQRSGDRVRVNARLVSVANGSVLWGETFDSPVDKVFTLQDRMGDAVASALALAPMATAPLLSPCDGGDALAYRAYLRGYYQLMRPDAKRLQEALAAFGEAIDRDPTCARAWAGTAFAYRALVITADRDPRELFPLAKAAVNRALAIDPASAEAYSSKGFIEFWYDWDWAKSEASLRHAIALNPNLAEAQLALAHLLVNIGRAPEAAPYARRAIALDPLSPLVNALAGSFLGIAGFKDESERHLNKTLELDPNSWHALRMRGMRSMKARDYPGAIATLRKAAEISHDSSQVLHLLGKAYAASGDRAAAEGVLAGLEKRRRADYVPATSIAQLTLALGDREGALDLLEQGYEERDVRMSFLLLDWNSLRDEPRLQALLKRMALPAKPRTTPRTSASP